MLRRHTLLAAVLALGYGLVARNLAAGQTTEQELDVAVRGLEGEDTPITYGSTHSSDWEPAYPLTSATWKSAAHLAYGFGERATEKTVERCRRAAGVGDWTTLEHGIVALGLIHDARAKPFLLQIASSTDLPEGLRMTAVEALGQHDLNPNEIGSVRGLLSQNGTWLDVECLLLILEHTGDLAAAERLLRLVQGLGDRVGRRDPQARLLLALKIERVRRGLRPRFPRVLERWTAEQRREWIEKNRAELIWDGARRRFVFRGSSRSEAPDWPDASGKASSARTAPATRPGPALMIGAALAAFLLGFTAAVLIFRRRRARPLHSSHSP